MAWISKEFTSRLRSRFLTSSFWNVLAMACLGCCSSVAASAAKTASVAGSWPSGEALRAGQTRFSSVSREAAAGKLAGSLGCSCPRWPKNDSTQFAAATLQIVQ